MTLGDKPKKAKARDKAIEDLFTRGVEMFIDPEGTFEEKLVKRPSEIVIKLGADPTRPDLHLGHAVTLRKLRQFQDRGARIVFLIGDFTAKIGDPTGKDKARPELTNEEIESNLETYKKQVSKILRTDPEVFTVLRNSDWFLNVTDMSAPPGTVVKITSESEGRKVEIPFDANSFVGKAFLFEESRMQVKALGHRQGIAVVTIKTLLETLRRITHSRLIERDMFMERIQKGNELYMHEMLYPVIQGIDSAVIAMIFGSCDLEIGGNDQTFNMLIGRDVMKSNNQVPQAVMATRLLTGLDGKEKMSKSLDNYVGINDEPNDMFGKIMSMPDKTMPEYFELATYTSQSEIETIKEGLGSGKLHPMDIKKRLAREIVSTYHGEKLALQSEENFENVFAKGEVPEELEVIHAQKGDTLSDILKINKIVPSNSHFKRLVDGGAVSNIETGEKITDVSMIVEKTIKLRVGKKSFIEIRV
ncbi:MAG: tyrosine--tRNA ligase [Minisyncoccia bacterium]